MPLGLISYTTGMPTLFGDTLHISAQFSPDSGTLVTKSLNIRKMIFKLNLVNFLLSCIFFSSVNSSFCFWNTGCPYKHFANKTPYNSVRGDIRDSVINVKGKMIFFLLSAYLLSLFCKAKFLLHKSRKL